MKNKNSYIVHILKNQIQDINNKLRDIKNNLKYLEKKLEKEENENESKKCKYSYADWCHNPEPEEQEKCNFYFNQKDCPNYKK